MSKYSIKIGRVVLRSDTSLVGTLDRSQNPGAFQENKIRDFHCFISRKLTLFPEVVAHPVTASQLTARLSQVTVITAITSLILLQSKKGERSTSHHYQHRLRSGEQISSSVNSKVSGFC
jgi:hypothetical protein